MSFLARTSQVYWVKSPNPETVRVRALPPPVTVYHPRQVFDEPTFRRY